LKSGTFLRYHTDFLQAERQTAIINIDESDPKWVGAWWIGFLIASILAMIAVFPILSFPKVLPDAVRWHRMRALSSAAPAADDAVTPSTSAAASGSLLDRLDAPDGKKEIISAEVMTDSTKKTPVLYQFW
uniref:Uncharacterized protein n=1 Tax=Plectus sambesii TaxID=2011161 RepID=A0A914V7A4_9BILA